MSAPALSLDELDAALECSAPDALAHRNPLPEISILLFGGRDGALDHLGYAIDRSSVFNIAAEVTILGRRIGCFSRKEYPNIAMTGEGWLMHLLWRDDPHRAHPVAFSGDDVRCASDLDALRAALRDVG